MSNPKFPLNFFWPKIVFKSYKMTKVTFNWTNGGYFKIIIFFKYIKRLLKASVNQVINLMYLAYESKVNWRYNTKIMIKKIQIM